MTSYAIIETGGKQLRVEPGRFYDIERLAVEEDDTVTIDKVLFVQNDGDISVGQPLVAGATVEGRVLKHFRGRKVIVYKMRPKKKTRKKQGHRQELTRLLINHISVGSTTIGESQTETAPTAQGVEVDAPIAVETAPVATAALAAEVIEAAEPDIVAVAATEVEDDAAIAAVPAEPVADIDETDEIEAEAEAAAETVTAAVADEADTEEADA